MTTIIVETSTDEHTKTEYIFWLISDFNPRLVLDTVRIMHKESTKHKWRATKRYSRINEREVPPGERLKLVDITPIPAEIIQKAKDELLKQVVVSTTVR